MATKPRGDRLRLTVDIPDDVLREVVEMTGEKSASRAVIAALKEFVRFSEMDRNRPG